MSLTLASLTLTAAPAGAAPTAATTPEQAAALVAQASQALEAVTEQVNEAQVTMQQQQGAAASAAQAAADAQSGLTVLRAEVAEVARGAFRGDTLGRFNALMTSDSADQFIAQVSTLDVIASHAGDLVDRAAGAADVAAQAQAQADAASATAQAALDQVTAQQADLQAQITAYRAQFDALTAAQQAAVTRQVSGASLAAPPVVQVGNGDLQAVIDTAMAQIGDPYIWAADGPDSFDCSGLMMYAYDAAGISLPHSSRIQSTMGTAVSRADLQPGDMVFFYHPVSHVGMYIGDGMMVQAPTAGEDVMVSSVDMAGYAGARRLIG